MECSKPSLAPFLISCGFLISVGRLLYPLSTPLTAILSEMPCETGTQRQGSWGEFEGRTCICVKKQTKQKKPLFQLEL